MRQVQINRNLILREDGKLFNVHTGEEYHTWANNRGYLCVTVDNKHRTVHSLVMEYFGPPKPGPEYQIDHIKRDQNNNSITNLRWVTAKQNCYNRQDNLPIGERRCDLPPREYKNLCNKRWRERQKKKKEGV